MNSPDSYKYGILSEYVNRFSAVYRKFGRCFTMSVLQSIFRIIFYVELLIGNLGNGFIAVVNCVDWIKRRKISLVDQILTGLAISRIGLLCSIITSVLTYSLYRGLRTAGSVMKLIYLTWTVTNHFSIWLATCLSIFYFLKIANYSHFLFLYFRWRVKIVISVTLLVSLALLFLNVVLTNTQLDFRLRRYNGNLSYSSSLRNTEQIVDLLLIINVMFSFIPFTLSLMTFLLLIFSLWKHLSKMQHKATGSRDASTTAHVKALHTVVTFLLLYAVFFLSYLVQIWSSPLPERQLTNSIFRATAMAFPSGHSLVLIVGNSKLRQASQAVLSWLSCRFKAMESSGP